MLWGSGRDVIGQLKGNGKTRKWRKASVGKMKALFFHYRTMCRGENSIVERLKRVSKYIQYNGFKSLVKCLNNKIFILQ